MNARNVTRQCRRRSASVHKSLESSPVSIIDNVDRALKLARSMFMTVGDLGGDDASSFCPMLMAAMDKQLDELTAAREGLRELLHGT